MKMSELRLNVQVARDFVQRAMQGYGFTAEEGAITADVLLTADLYGIQSHGIHRLMRYAGAVREGSIDPKAKVTTVFETPLSAVWDAPKTLGQSVAHRGMTLAIEKARQHGFGIVTVRGSNHYGIAGYYTRMAVAADMIGLCMTNTEAIAIPTYGKKAMLGTNPIAVAMPADPTPFWYDAATTVVTRGKLEVYNKVGKALPAGWAADENGEDCADSDRVLKNIIAKAGGGIFPLGGATEETGSHKGYGLGLIVEMMTSILAGGTTAPNVKHSGNADTSFTFAALDYGLFGDKKAIKGRMSALLQELRDSPKADGQDRIYTHGEKELECAARYMEEGIPVNEKTLVEMREIAAELGIEANF